MKIIGLLGFFVLLAGSTLAETNIDEGWKFVLQDATGAESPDFDDGAWQVLDVPHDWSVEGAYDRSNPMGERGGYLPAGIGWYRKTISVPAAWKGKHVEVAFDGVFRNSVVWANGEKLGERPYGWISFAYDISKIVQESEAVTFAVRVDNEKQPGARWYSGSGIYGHTWIRVQEKVRVLNSGVYVRTKGDAVELDTEVVNGTGKSAKAVLRTQIKDASGKIVDTSETKFNLDGGETKSIGQRFVLSNPDRWSVDSPYLYTAVSELEIGKQRYESASTRFGFRDIEWKPKTGMWVDGKNVKLRGVCNHQDAGAFGAGVPDKILRFRIEQLKAMGVNCIRVSHNPQTPIFYELCDEIGMFVLDEIFDGWGKKAEHDYGRYSFEQWWKLDMTDWIKRDRSHASVVAWSVGNETHGEVGKDLVALCHELDPTRLVTSGSSETQYMDIFGANGGSERDVFF